MPEHKTGIVSIQRGRYSPHFQVARAYVSAASALVPTESQRAADMIDNAISELHLVALELRKEKTR